MSVYSVRRLVLYILWCDDSCQSQTLVGSQSTSKGLTLPRYSACVFYIRFALRSVLVHRFTTAPPMSSVTVNTLCAELWADEEGKRKESELRPKRERSIIVQHQHFGFFFVLLCFFALISLLLCLDPEFKGDEHVTLPAARAASSHPSPRTASGF